MAAEIGVSVATEVANTLVGKATKEASYLCCYQSYVDDFEEEKCSLSATKRRLLKDIEQAKNKNENEIEEDVELWLKRANHLIEEDSKEKKKCFGFCTNCLWQYERGKELEGKTQKMKQLIKDCNFRCVARSTGRPGMEFYSRDFMNFESRKSKFEQLKEALKDDKKSMIGLHGMGGTGKTTMAFEVGKEVEELKVFNKVIFVVVSKDATPKKIRDGIAEQLHLKLEEAKGETEQAKNLWKRIAEGGEKVLIILDDVWKKLILQEIGVPLGRHHRGCCSVLVTTRELRVCREMKCQEMIPLDVLSNKDAVDLFLFHAGKSDDDSCNDFKVVAKRIVEKCGKLPVAVAAVGRTLNSKPLNDWEEALIRLQNYEQIDDVDEELKDVYNSLRLSYDNLENEKAKQLFLLCSLFPEDYEISTEFLSKIAIGMGLCGKADKYYVARSQVSVIKDELIDSCLLLKAGEEYVKMHDLIREVALWIAHEKIQVAMDSKTTLKENIRYSSWNINDFPNCFGGSQLEVLLVWINAKGSLTIQDVLFKSMTRLRVLLLFSGVEFSRTSVLSLPQSIQSLTNIQTLVLRNWELGDISIIANLPKLETLGLTNCSIIELPNEVNKLEKLRLLSLKYCEIRKNNPFEVIERCLQLEELYYVKNNDISNYMELPQIRNFPELQRYHIVGYSSFYFMGQNVSTKRYFNPKKLEAIFSKEIFKSLAARAEILQLEKYNGLGWTNLIPDMVAIEDGGMKDLIKLYLAEWSEIKCLIHTEHSQSSVNIFSKLVKLKLSLMDVKALCCGPFPVGFLKQLEKLYLNHCLKLESTLFKGKLELGNLKLISLGSCSMTCLFHPSTAQSLKKLETLDIGSCSKLKYIIKDEGSEEEKVDDHDPNQKSYGSMFPKLKFLKVYECHELEFILPICFGEDLLLLEQMRICNCEKLKYIFGQYPEEGGLYQMGKEIILPSLEEMTIKEVPKFVDIYPDCCLPLSSEVQKSSPTTNDVAKVEEASLSNSFSWASLCCFLPKSSATSVNDPSVSKVTQPDHIASQALKKEHLAQSFFTPLLYPYKLREMKIQGCFNLTSFLTLSIASSMSSLEILKVGKYDGLKHIVTHEGGGHDHMNCSSIFPILQVLHLKNLPSLHSFCEGIDFQTLETRVVRDSPKISSTSSPYSRLQDNEGQEASSERELPQALKIEHTTQSFFTPSLYLHNLREMKIEGCFNLTSFFTLSVASSMSSLEILEVEKCDRLKHIVTHEGIGHDHKNCSSVFPKLQVMRLKNLPSLHSFCEGIDFQTLETRVVRDYPKISLASSPYSQPQDNEGQEASSERELPQALKTELVFNTAQCFLIPPLFPHNLREMTIMDCSNLVSLFTLSVASSMLSLERLEVKKCGGLKYIITDEGDGHDHMNCSSIFPNLREVVVSNCSLLESLFPASHSRTFVHLQSLKIIGVHKFRYVFGKCSCEDNLTYQNKNVEIRLPAFKSLHLDDVPNMVSIFTENYNLTAALSLEELVLEKCPQLPVRLVGGHERQEDLSRRKAIQISLHNLNSLGLKSFEMNTIYDLEGLQIEGPVSSSLEFMYLEKLPELRDICMGPKNILSLQNLFHLRISGCKKLKVIFSTSILRSLPQLSRLRVSDCEELVCIVEENEQNPVHSHKACFPMLASIIVEKCKNLKFLFSISTCGMLLQLFLLTIEDAPKLVQVFGPEQGEAEELVMENVLPRLRHVVLTNLPSLHIICQGIDFQSVQTRVVRGCPNISLTSTESTPPEGTPLRNESELPPAQSEEASETVKHDTTIHKQNNSSPNLTESPKAATNEIVEQFPISDIPATTTPSSTSDMVIEETIEPSFQERSKLDEAIIANQIMDSELSNASPSALVIPLENESPLNIEATVGEGPSSEKYDKASSSTHSEPKISNPFTLTLTSTKESMADQEAFGESISTNEATQRVDKPSDNAQKIKEPTNECSSRERSNKTALAIPPTIAKMTSPLTNSISGPKKPQIATSATHTGSGSSQLDLLDISAITEPAKGEIMVNQVESSIGEEIKFDQINPQQFEEDDLIRLLQIIEEGADMEVHMPFVSKIAALKYDNKVTRALADLDTSLKMGLNEMASSKESSLRLENALNILSSHCSEDGPPSHGLKATIDSLQQEIQSILSSFKQAYVTIDTFTKLEEKEKFINEERSQRKEAAITLLSEIRKTLNSMAEAQLKEAELKEQISRLQAELNSKEKEIKECEIQLSSLNEQKKKSVSDTIGFINEFEATKKERSQMVEDQIKARQELENVDIKWSSCVANLRKTTLLLGIHLKQKL